MARKRQTQTQVAPSDAALATLQVLYCELDGEASLVDCVAMHAFGIGMYELAPASPISLVAVDVDARTKRVLQRWADDVACVQAAFRVDGGRPSVTLAGRGGTLRLALAGALA